MIPENRVILVGKHGENTGLAIGLQIIQIMPQVASEIEILCFCPFAGHEHKKNIIVAF
jgi:hypothetical protein